MCLQHENNRNLWACFNLLESRQPFLLPFGRNVPTFARCNASWKTNHLEKYRIWTHMYHFDHVVECEPASCDWELPDSHVRRRSLEIEENTEQKQSTGKKSNTWSQNYASLKQYIEHLQIRFATVGTFLQSDCADWQIGCSGIHNIYSVKQQPEWNITYCSLAGNLNVSKGVNILIKKLKRSRSNFGIQENTMNQTVCIIWSIW